MYVRGEFDHINPSIMNRAIKKVFLTGGTAGIGRATLLLLAQKGYQIVAIGRDPAKKEDVLADARELGVEEYVGVILQDLANTDALEKLLPQIWADDGPFDVLINNAALGFDSIQGKSAAEISYLVNTNLTSYLYLSGFFLEQMVRKQIQGDIIHIGSMSADTRERNSSGYVATKSGIQGFSEALRKEANPHGIRVSLIEPGAVGTDIQAPSPKEQRELQKQEEMLTAEDIARAIAFVLEQDRRISISEMQIKPLRQYI